jgi:hypothetical protein
VVSTFDQPQGGVPGTGWTTWQQAAACGVPYHVPGHVFPGWLKVRAHGRSHTHHVVPPSCCQACALGLVVDGRTLRLLALPSTSTGGCAWHKRRAAKAAGQHAMQGHAWCVFGSCEEGVQCVLPLRRPAQLMPGMSPWADGRWHHLPHPLVLPSSPGGCPWHKGQVAGAAGQHAMQGHAWGVFALIARRG